MLCHSLTVHRYQSLGSHQTSQPGQFYSELRTPARIPWPRGLWYTEMVCQKPLEEPQQPGPGDVY